MSTSTLSLYIKRAEVYHTREYITNAFCNQQYGIVKDITFIKKTSDLGKEYNGVIVTFERWFVNEIVNKLWTQLSNSVDKTAKIFHDSFGQKFWFAIEYHNSSINNSNVDNTQISSLSNIDLTLSDADKVKKLEELVKTMEAKIQIMNIKTEKFEKEIMNYEDDYTFQNLLLLELKCQLREKDEEIEVLNNNHIKEVHNLQCKLACSSIELIKKENECNGLRQSLLESQSIITFIECQANEMRDMLHIGLNDFDYDYKPKFSKMKIEELID